VKVGVCEREPCARALFRILAHACSAGPLGALALTSAHCTGLCDVGSVAQGLQAASATVTLFRLRFKLWGVSGVRGWKTGSAVARCSSCPPKFLRAPAYCWDLHMIIT
jgi:hypothetical protein